MSEQTKPAFDWRAFTPEDSPKTPMDIAQDPRNADLWTPKLAVGDPAFDFDLPLYDFSDGSERVTGARLRLQDEAHERPVALVFGSYT